MAGNGHRRFFIRLKALILYQPILVTLLVFLIKIIMWSKAAVLKPLAGYYGDHFGIGFDKVIRTPIRRFGV